MDKRIVLQLLIGLRNNSEKGLSLIELIVALIISGIVLTAAASGFINVLRANQNVESKTVRSATIARAIAYIQDEIKEAKAVTAVAVGSTQCPSASVDSAHCLKLTMPDDSTVLYGFDDISTGTNVYLKPGLLKRQEYDSSGNAVLQTGQTSAWDTQYTTVVDGLTSVNETAPTTVACNQELTAWPSGTTVYGGTSGGKGGFRFCLADNTANNRLARIFLYGHIIGVADGNNVISGSTISFARSE
ncbi:prepilin-type N-terminal cleavage/methylation domain-containing protein [Cyanobacterium aponinum]|uniref:Prepilin-type N-terminal cleavage/methylation domain-containing protein n=1 Tax=Cyanobacterium aponinum 0216 TaxID=2676140 RepID=A0A844GTT6_9CHRO|nr:prepilin-type N-terminal cleavage/methylation domain-containing protein [Cyanobacterium aponinum]MTF37486.1 prepilin-type N-terminal cleavage/methylation domain-containing protein [Cyanobacterium aponinum 0216]